MAKKIGLGYALLCCGKIVLCDHRVNDGIKFESICQRVLDSLPTGGSNGKLSFDIDSYICHVYIKGDLVYMCVTGGLFDKNVAFNCLFELEQKLLSSGLQEISRTVRPYGLRASFSDTMAAVVSKYSSRDVLGRMESHVEEVTGVMRQNIDKVYKRGDNLDHLTERSDHLAHASTNFRQSATKLRRKLCVKNAKLWIILIAIIIALLLVIAVIIISVLAAQKKL